jgi:hypothetical protein
VCLAVWRLASVHILTTNTACLTFHLQFRTVADTLNSWYIVCGHFYRWDLAWGAISNDTWWDTPINCWQCRHFVTTNNLPRGTYHWRIYTPEPLQC